MLRNHWKKPKKGRTNPSSPEQGVRVTVYPEPDKLGKQMKYADSIRVPFVCVLGESEIAAGKVTVKNMRTGEQQSVDRGEVARSVRVADDSI